MSNIQTDNIDLSKLIFKYRKDIERLTKIRIESFILNDKIYSIENWDEPDENISTV